MADPALVDRLAALANLAGIPRAELVWLVDHGRLEVHEAGAVVGPKGKRIRHLWIILSGRIVVHVDRGAGPRQVIEWRTGEVTGMLPYSRMTGPPGDNLLTERTEYLAVSDTHFQEMVCQCPTFTAYTVHLMLDRARSFNASDLHDEKMISLGRLAAGLAHELNNPASATARGAQHLLASLADADAAARALGEAGLTGEAFEAIQRVRTTCLAGSTGAVLSPIEQSDLEDAIADWLTRHGSDPVHAAPLAGTGVTIEKLDDLAEAAPGEALDVVVRWFAAACSTHALAVDIERAASRIHELVATIKKFTYMDNRAGPESVDVEAGLRDTIRVVASKAKGKAAAIGLAVGAELPRVRANGGELNQVWLNLIDNAIDAVSEGGRIDITADREPGRVVVTVADDGPGIPAEVLPQIFDPFFTTKPPGQGTGLGLEIARRLLRRYNGDIAVQSRPGRTEFRVSLLIDTPSDNPPPR
jgi:signal transduction histidine kinase